MDSANYFCDTQVQAFNKVVITISNMTKPSRFLKIYNIADGITRQFYNEELENVEIIEQITNNNTALNINEASLNILPASNTGVLFQRTLPFSIYRNNTLYGQFFVTSSTSNVSKNLYQVKVSDYINVLEAQSYLGGLYTSKNVAELISDLLDGIPYTLDATLQNKTITGYLPILTKREALRQIAFCIGAVVDTSRSDAINIKPIATTSSRNITKSEILNIKTTQEKITTKIAVNINKLTTKGASADTIYSEKLNGATYVLFDNPTYSLSISGGSIVDSNINYAIISGTGGTVTLTGKQYQIATRQVSKANAYAVTTDIEKVDQYNTTLLCDGEDILDYLQFVEYKIKASFLMSNTKVGDIVSLDGVTCRVMSLNYNLWQTNIYCDADMEAYYE